MKIKNNQTEIKMYDIINIPQQFIPGSEYGFDKINQVGAGFVVPAGDPGAKLNKGGTSTHVQGAMTRFNQKHKGQNIKLTANRLSQSEKIGGVDYQAGSVVIVRIL